jgi:pimeloyl-ACP methyl ester carboxylesterase
VTFFFFGSADRQLFGVYHASHSSVPERGAAVLCPPWGPEYIASHRVLRRLAVMLSERGYHVLRFDYFGTGDSAGSREDGDMESWYADASAAVDELRDMSGISAVTVFGIRLGAVVAWRLAVGRGDVDAVVMWDPVIDGARYIQNLLGAQDEIDRWWLSPRQTRRVAPASMEAIDLLGFPLTSAMRRSVAAITPADYRQSTRARVFVFFSDLDPADAVLQQSFESTKTVVAIETMAGQTPWREDEGGVPGQMPFPMLERMVEAVS